MSIAILATATAELDGVTVLDLDANSPDPTTQRFEYTAADIGVLPLFTLGAIGQSDFYIEEISVDSPGSDSFQVRVTLPNGTEIIVPFTEGTLASQIIVPQGASVTVTASLVGVPQPGTVQIWGYGLSHDTWYKVQCCHVFAPDRHITGNMAFTGNLAGVETVIPAVDTFVRIGAGNPGTHPVFVLDPQSFPFSLVGITAPTQTLRYDGLINRTICIFASMSVQNQALTAQGFTIRLLQNGTPISNAEAQSQTGGLITSAGSVTTHGIVLAEPGDEFTIEFANNTSDADLTVSSAQLTMDR